jgi:hypothetical protein
VDAAEALQSGTDDIVRSRGHRYTTCTWHVGCGNVNKDLVVRTLCIYIDSINVTCESAAQMLLQPSVTCLAEGRSSGFSTRHCWMRSQMSAGQSRGMSGVGSLPRVDGDVPVTICRHRQHICCSRKYKVAEDHDPRLCTCVAHVKAPTLSSHARSTTHLPQHDAKTVDVGLELAPARKQG